MSDTNLTAVKVWMNGVSKDRSHKGKTATTAESKPTPGRGKQAKEERQQGLEALGREKGF